MTTGNQINVKGLTDEDLALLKTIGEERGMGYAGIVSAGLRLLEESLAEEDAPADPSRDDCRAVERALRAASETACAVIHGYAAKATAEADEARIEAEEAIAASRKAAESLAAAKASADALSDGLRADLDAALAREGEIAAELAETKEELAAANVAKQEAERKLLESVETERAAVAAASSLRERAARLEGRLEAMKRPVDARPADEGAYEGEVA